MRCTNSTWVWSHYNNNSPSWRAFQLLLSLFLMKSSASRPNRADSYWHWGDCLMLRPLCLWVMVDLACHLQFFFSFLERRARDKGGLGFTEVFSPPDWWLSVAVCVCVFPICFQGWGPVWWKRLGPCGGPLGFCVCTTSMGDGNETGDCWTFPPPWQHVSPTCMLFFCRKDKESEHDILSLCSTSGTAEGLSSSREETILNIMYLWSCI